MASASRESSAMPDMVPRDIPMKLGAPPKFTGTPASRKPFRELAELGELAELEPFELAELAELTELAELAEHDG